MYLCNSFDPHFVGECMSDPAADDGGGHWHSFPLSLISQHDLSLEQVHSPSSRYCLSLSVFSGTKFFSLKKQESQLVQRLSWFFRFQNMNALTIMSFIRFFHHRFFIAASMALTSIRFKDTFWKKFRIWPNFSVKSKRISFLFFQQRAMSCCKRKCNFHGAVVCTPFTFFLFCGAKKKAWPWCSYSSAMNSTNSRTISTAALPTTSTLLSS